jgi:hypothetical protein
MEENNLPAQAGHDNEQDFSKGKKVHHDHRTINTDIGTKNNSRWVFHFGTFGEMALVTVVALVVIFAALVMLIQPWTWKQFDKPPPEPEPPSLLLTMPVDNFMDDEAFQAKVVATQPGFLYVLGINAKGEPYVIFPNKRRTNPRVRAQEEIDLQLSLSGEAGQPVPLKAHFPDGVSGDEVRERLLFYLLDCELRALSPGSLDDKPQREVLLKEGLLTADFLNRVAGEVAARDETVPAPQASSPAVLVQMERSYKVRRKVQEPTSSAESPRLLKAETGLWVDGAFIPTATFKPGQLLSVRLRLSAPGYVRLCYEPVDGHPMVVYPNERQPELTLAGGVDLVLPDPRHIYEAGARSEVLELTNDQGRSITERLCVQVSDSPFDFAGSMPVAGTAFHSFGKLSLDQLLTRGVSKRTGPEAAAAQLAQDAARLPASSEQERLLSIVIATL